MNLSSGIRFLNFLSLIIFAFIFFNYKVNPDLKEIFLDENIADLYGSDSGKYSSGLISPDKRVNVGKEYYFKYDKNWYQLIHLSFWRKEYLNLIFVNKQLKIKSEEIKYLDKNNFAFGTMKNDNVAYACMQNEKKFHYTNIPENIIHADDLNHWFRTFIKNINFVFYSFKPSDYECLLVITSNTKFFESSDKKINEIIFSKFSYE